MSWNAVDWYVWDSVVSTPWTNGCRSMSGGSLRGVKWRRDSHALSAFIIEVDPEDPCPLEGYADLNSLVPHTSASYNIHETTPSIPLEREIHKTDTLNVREATGQGLTSQYLIIQAVTQADLHLDDLFPN